LLTMLARRAGWFSFRHDYGLGYRVIAVCIGRPIVVAIPWPSADILTIAEKMMPGDSSMRREMASSVKRVRAHAMASTACVDRHKE